MAEGMNRGLGCRVQNLTRGHNLSKNGGRVQKSDGKGEGPLAQKMWSADFFGKDKRSFCRESFREQLKGRKEKVARISGIRGREFESKKGESGESRAHSDS